MDVKNIVNKISKTTTAKIMNAKNILNKTSKAAIVKIILIVAILIIGALVLSYSKCGGVKAVSSKEAANKTVDFINKFLISGGKGTASLKNVVEESGLYKIIFMYQNNQNEIYVTRDGKFLFPIMQGVPINMDQTVGQQPAQQQPAQQTQKTCKDLKKTDQPLLTAFIVSRCPFGLQMQRALAEAVKNIPSLADNISVKYISGPKGSGFTSMHGDDEFAENLRQICLRQETDKYWSYVSCYIKKGDSASCLKFANVDEVKLNSCIGDKSRGIKYITDDYNLQKKNNVSGSPTVILNDDSASEYSFGGRTADAIKSLVCCGSKTQPGFCSSALSTDSAATGFSETYSSGSQSNDTPTSCGK